MGSGQFEEVQGLSELANRVGSSHSVGLDFGNILDRNRTVEYSYFESSSVRERRRGRSRKESCAVPQTHCKNLKLSELSRFGPSSEYETAQLIPKVEVASSSLVTRLLNFPLDSSVSAIATYHRVHMSPEVTPGWRFVHIGLEQEAVQIDGVNVWSLDWGRSHGTIIVAHPSYLGERHAMSIYRIKLAADRQIVFAAGEFSNGVWGFYEPS